MNMALIIIPWVAMVPMVLGYMVQTFWTYKKGGVETLSSMTFMQNFVSSLCWGVNAIFVLVIPSVISNIVTLMCISVLMYFIVKAKTEGRTKALTTLIFLMTISVTLLALMIINAFDRFIIVDAASKFVVSIIAGILSMSMFIPQLIKMVRTKDTKGFSYGLSILYTGALLIWSIFWILREIDGFALSDWLIPFVFAVVPFLIQSAIIWFKYNNEKSKKTTR